MQGSLITNAAPLFPIGCPRTGTTFLTRLLNAHPNVLTTYETSVFRLLNARISGSRSPQRIGRLYAKEYGELWADQLEQSSRHLVESFYEKIAALEGKGELTYWGDKHPHHAQQGCLNFLERIYPGARYIYIVRDPRDAACSIAEMQRGTFRDALQTWKEIADPYEEFQEAASERLLQIRYEDLVADRPGVSRQIFDWLGLDWMPELDSFLKRRGNRDVHRTRFRLHVRRDFANTSVGRWRSELSEADIDFAEDLVAGFLQRYGYAFSPGGRAGRRAHRPAEANS